MGKDPAFFLVIDLEATCDEEGRIPERIMEIIEIGAVLVDGATLEPVSELATFVRPVIRPKLTEFCTKLTTITQADVDSAPTFPEAIAALGRFVGQREALFCSWGDYDRNQFLQDCEYHRVAYPFRSGHLNLKAEFARILGLRKKLGIAEALRHLGMTFEGSHHRGLDDARNIARIVRRVCIGA